ncbi:MAG: pyroglutamyl-peptidase I [Tissierellia bacterium]|nr:pyroglutamyl-peptidase I [Tissierellia bacterium]
MKILISGFDPFGKDKINPSIEAVKMLPDTIKGADIIKIEIPTVVGKSIDKLKEKIEEVRPDAVITVGQAAGRSDITIERVAINVDDAIIPDNEGNQPVDEKIIEDGPDAYFLTLPIKAIVENIKSVNIPASVSNTAGTFICNHVAYGMAHLKETKYPNMITGFIHVPYIPEQVLERFDKPSMSLDMIEKALEKAIETVVDNPCDFTSDNT